MTLKNPLYPIYIVSKGRSKIGFTWKYLDKMNVPYYVVIEEQEYKAYSETIDKNKLIIRDQKFVDEYESCMKLNSDQSRGSGPSRNCAWEHALENGHEYYWCMDDNIRGFYRVHQNRKVLINDGSFFRVMEEWVNRYQNVYMAGPHYAMFVPVKSVKVHPPLILNSRIYSCNLIKTKQRARWRGRYNEDTILSLDILKAGYCTALFCGFVQNKETTQKLGGGNMIEIYKTGTLEKSQMLVNEHPDVARLIKRYGRWHHFVDYKPFKNNKLIRKIDAATIDLSNKFIVKKK